LIKLVFLEIGVSIYKLGLKEPEELLHYVAGPLGNPTTMVINNGIGVLAICSIARVFDVNVVRFYPDPIIPNNYFRN
jgi:hypothetical protein